MSDGAAERALARLARYRPPTPDEIQEGIRATMREVIKTPNYNPNATGFAPRVSIGGAVEAINGPVLDVTNPPPVGTGWRTAEELKPPPGAEPGGIIDQLADAWLGPVQRKPKEPSKEPKG